MTAGLKNHDFPRLPVGRQGFTLIEIIVSVTLLLLLSGLFIANYNGFNNSQAARQATSDVINNLQAVRTSASSGIKPIGCDTLIGYTINFPTASSYTASALCDIGGVQQSVGAAAVYTLPAGVTFSPIPQSITFYALSRGASADQTITIVGNGVILKISIYSSGVVSDFVPTPTP